ncbi:hypothetical protein [Streptacidiphilus sp. PAMC 29251]
MTDWSQLRHAYGTAEDIPDLLDRVDPDPQAREWGDLWSRLCHQGTVYSASYAALPALTQMARQWSPAERHMPLLLAGAIVASSDQPYGHEDPHETHATDITALLGLVEGAVADQGTAVGRLPGSPGLRGPVRFDIPDATSLPSRLVFGQEVAVGSSTLYQAWDALPDASSALAYLPPTQNRRAGCRPSIEPGMGMDDWSFGEWQGALGTLDAHDAALVGLAAAERISGCLGDERFLRHGSSGSEMVTELLQRAWVNAAAAEDSSAARIRELADRLADWSGEYLTLSLTELFHTYGSPAGDGADEDNDDPADAAADLDEFMEEAVPEGAVMMHVDALTAVAEAVVACAGGPWDGALRCLQTVAMAARQGDPQLPGPGVELQRQQEDLALVRAAGREERGRTSADLRVRAEADARGWKQATERLDLLHD